MVRDWLRKREDIYYHLLNVLSEADCIADFVLIAKYLLVYT
jgi:hypothetical protein